MNRSRALSLSMLALAASAALFQAAPAMASDGQCTANYTLEGNFFSGRSFQSWGVYPDISTEEAFRRAYANVARQGFRIQQADAASGVIAAEQNVSGSNKVVPLNVIVENDGGAGSRVSVSFTTSGGLAVGEADVKDGFCQILDAVAR